MNMENRINFNHTSFVNPLLDTFDMLHLQEMSLRNKIINRPKHVKNTRKDGATRRGGKVNKKKRKMLDQLVKFGYSDKKIDDLVSDKATE